MQKQGRRYNPSRHLTRCRNNAGHRDPIFQEKVDIWHMTLNLPENQKHITHLSKWTEWTYTWYQNKYGDTSAFVCYHCGNAFWYYTCSENICSEENNVCDARRGLASLGGTAWVIASLTVRETLVYWGRGKHLSFSNFIIRWYNKL